MLRSIPALALSALVVTPAGGQTPCTRDLDEIVRVVSADYAGYPLKGPRLGASLHALTDSVRDQAAAAGTRECTRALRRWVAAFGDRHLAVGETHPDSTPAEAAGAALDTQGIRYPDDSTAIIRLPSFGMQQKASIDSLLRAHHERVVRTPYVVVDVRANGGGWTEAYAGLLPLLYTDPIRQHGMDVYVSEGNLAAARAMADNARAPAELREQARRIVARMEENRGGFAEFAGDRVIRLDSVLPLPRAIAVVYDGSCASSCEQLLLDARQSSKVLLVAMENSRGLLDYGNARRVALPSGERVLFLPMTRSRRLPAEPLDMIGVAPHVKVPRGEDPVGYAIRRLRH